MTALACIGFLNVEDTAYPGRPEVHGAAGGAALYFAAASTIWGAQVSLVSRVGEDYPPAYLEALAAAGLDLTLLQRVPGQTMAGRTVYDPDGGRTYQMYVSPERRLALSPSPDDWPPGRTAAFDAIHIATMPPETQRAWLEKIRPDAPLVSLDTDISFIERQRTAVAEALTATDIFFLNETEAWALYPGPPLPEVARRVAGLGPRVVAVKRGADGALLHDRDTGRTIEIPAFPTKVVDVTGAGDGFAAGFMVGFLETGDLHRAGLRGAVTASLTIEDYGALHLLGRTSAETAARLASETDRSTDP